MAPGPDWCLLEARVHPCQCEWLCCAVQACSNPLAPMEAHHRGSAASARTSSRSSELTACLRPRAQLAPEDRTTSRMIDARISVQFRLACLMMRSNVPGRDSSALASWLSIAARIAASWSVASPTSRTSSAPSAPVPVRQLHSFLHVASLIASTPLRWYCSRACRVWGHVFHKAKDAQ